MKFNLEFSQKVIQPTYQKVLQEASKEVEIKGFRKGKAPIHLVSEQLDQSKVQEEVLNQLIPDAYLDYVQKNKLKPIGQPEIKPLKIEPDKDWVIEVEIAEYPEIKLGDYKKTINTNIKKAETPPEKKKEKENKEQADSQQLNIIFDSLLESCQVEVPEILIRQEVNQKLSQLISQLDQIGVSLEQYSSSVNKTIEDIKADYTKIASEKLQLEFILDEIQKTENIETTQKQIDEFIDKLPNKNEKTRAQSNPNLQASIKYSLDRQKVIEYLKSLIK